MEVVVVEIITTNQGKDKKKEEWTHREAGLAAETGERTIGFPIVQTSIRVF